MRAPHRVFLLTLVILWAALSIGGVLYARHLELPGRISAPVLAAILWEASLYLVPGFPRLREAIEERWSPTEVAAGLAASALAPYCVYALPTGTFHWTKLALLAGLAAVASFWYLWLPRTGLTDAAFLVYMAAVVLSGAFSAIYTSPAAGVHLEILGGLMWTRVGVMVTLCFRRAKGIGFGFVPTREEWWIGLKQFLCFVPIGLPLALALGHFRWQPVQIEWWKTAPLALGTFLGMLWVVALTEEFFFRGLLQQWLCQWLANRTAGWIAASVMFGLVHLPFRAFPNWRFALVAGIAGLFYGQAYSQSGSIRAAMVAHALMNTTRVLLFAP